MRADRVIQLKSSREIELMAQGGKILAATVQMLRREVRAGISTFGRLTSVAPQLDRLARDLTSGNWERRNAELRNCADLDVGYRLVVADL